MKPQIRAPFFEIGVKNYLFGEDVIKLALAADAAAEEFDVDVLFIAPYTEIRSVAERTKHLIVIAPYMDLISPGRGIADVLPEAVKAAGAKGVVINHCERPMSLSAVKKTIERANELDMLSFVCADTIIEAQAIALLHPDVINPEPTELIGSGETSSMSFVLDSIRMIKRINPAILVEQAAGITKGRQVFDFIMTGAEGTGASSGICTAADPCAAAREMIQQVRTAINVLKSMHQGEIK